MPITTNSAAPALTPRMPGSASGLRVSPCIIVPATPSAAPTSRPTIDAGTRNVRTISSSGLLGSYEKMASMTVLERDRLGPHGDPGQADQQEHAEAGHEPPEQARPTEPPVAVDGPSIARWTTSPLTRRRGSGPQP